jgi:ArsR family transcriptional regulator, arsenate/arsenite/antimonite-responsive transcriptional repressor
MDDEPTQSFAVNALAALAHDTRLAVFRLLVKAGPDGMIAGAIAEHQGVPASTMSHHLAALDRAGLVSSERESRLIHYRADYAAMRRLLMFLMQDCCQGAPEMCGDLITGIACEPPHPQTA